MKTRILLLSALFMGSVALTGCGDDPSDPADTSGEATDAGRTDSGSETTDSGSETSTTDSGSETSTTDSGSTTTDSGSTTTDSGTTTTDSGSTTTDSGSTTDGGGDTGSNSCADDVFFTGQVYTPTESDPLDPRGGVAMFEAYDSGYDAGIQALLDAAPTSATEGENVASGLTVQLTDVTVTATSYNTSNTTRANRIMWLGDANGGVKVFLGAEAEDMHSTFNIKVGQRISLVATEITNYNSVIEITAVEPGSWTLGSEENFVYINDLGTDDITIELVNEVVRSTGTLDGGAECGTGFMCYDFNYGGTGPITFRTNSQFLAADDCITFVGAVGAFNGTPQIGTETYDWAWNYSSRD